MKNEVDICQISVRCLSDACQISVGYVHMLVAVSMLFFLSTMFTFILGMMAQIGEDRNGMTSGTTTNETYGSLSVRQMKHMEIWWKLWKYGKIRKDMETCENVWKKNEERNMYRSATYCRWKWTKTSAHSTCRNDIDKISKIGRAASNYWFPTPKLYINPSHFW